jgi:dephospho-CoA kinase
MKLFGLTGGVGMGKSTAAELLTELGVVTIDTDVIAREIVQPGSEALEEIKRRFGPQVVGLQGELRRDEVARIVFASAPARQDLEAILHPRIREIWLRQVAQWRIEGKLKAAVVIPLLFETGAEKHFDAKICVACSALTQEQRLAARGWSADQVRQRIAAQLPIETKVAMADYVVWTEGTPEAHQRQLERILSGR